MDLGGGEEGDHKKPNPTGDDDGGNDNDNDRSQLSEESSLDTGSLNENIEEPLALLDMCNRVEKVDAKIDYVNAQVGSLNLKLDLVLKIYFQSQDCHPFHSR